MQVHTSTNGKRKTRLLFAFTALVAFAFLVLDLNDSCLVEDDAVALMQLEENRDQALQKSQDGMRQVQHAQHLVEVNDKKLAVDKEELARVLAGLEAEPAETRQCLHQPRQDKCMVWTTKKLNELLKQVEDRERASYKLRKDAETAALKADHLTQMYQDAALELDKAQEKTRCYLSWNGVALGLGAAAGTASKHSPGGRMAVGGVMLGAYATSHGATASSIQKTQKSEAPEDLQPPTFPAAASHAPPQELHTLEGSASGGSAMLMESHAPKRDKTVDLRQEIAEVKAEMEKAEERHTKAIAAQNEKIVAQNEKIDRQAKEIAEHEQRSQEQAKEIKDHLNTIRTAQKQLSGCVSLKENSDIKEIRKQEAAEEHRVERLSAELSAQRKEAEVQSLSAVGEGTPSLRAIPRGPWKQRSDSPEFHCQHQHKWVPSSKWEECPLRDEPAPPRTRRTKLRLGTSATLHNQAAGDGGPYDGGCPYNISEPDKTPYGTCNSAGWKQACLNAGHENYANAMLYCRQMCTIARHPDWNNTLWCDPAVHAIHMAGPVYMPSGSLPIGHQNCQDKYRAQMSNTDDTPLSNDGNESPWHKSIAPGDLLNRRQPTSTPVALCGKCVDRSFMLQAAMVVGLQMVLGVCIPISSHPLFARMRDTCGDGSGSDPDDMTSCTLSSMPMQCEEFVSGFGAVERFRPSGSIEKDHTHKYTEDAKTFASRPETMDGVAYTCAGVQIRDAYDTKIRDGLNIYKMRVYRAAIGYVVECHGSRQATPQQIADGNLAEPSLECTRHEETKGCRTKVITLTDIASDEEGSVIKYGVNSNDIKTAIKQREDSVNSGKESMPW
jgi:hypothetical protein